MPFRRTLRHTALASAAVCCLVPAASRSQERPDPTAAGNGPRALGMSNAVTALVDDLSAIGWNPAGLSYLERAELGFSSRVLILATGAKGTTNNPTPTGYPRYSATGEYAGALDLLDYAAAAVPFRVGSRRVTVGVAYRRFHDSLRPGSYKANRRESNGRYFSTVKYSSAGAVRAISPAVGIEVTERLRLGATANILSGEQTYKIRGPLTFSSTSRETGYAGLAPQLGAMYQLREDLRLGAQLTLPHDRTFTRDNDTTQVPVTLEAPMQLTVGVAKRLNAKAILTVDAHYAPWSKSLLSEDATGDTVPTNTGRKDAHGVGIGYERDVTTDIRRSDIRAGLFFRGSSYEDLNEKQVSVYGFSVGQSWFYETLTVDLGATYSRSTRWTRTSNDQSTITLTNKDLVVSLGFRRHFGRVRGE